MRRYLAQLLFCAYYLWGCSATVIELPSSTPHLVYNSYCFDCQRGRLRSIHLQTTNNHIYSGQNVALSPESFLLLQKTGAAPIVVKREATRQIQIVDHRDSMARAAIWTGALAAVGAASGILIWGIHRQKNDCPDCPSAAAHYVGWPLLALMGGGAGGAALGSLLGLPFGQRYIFELSLPANNH